MAAFDPANIDPGHVGDAAEFTHYVNQMKGKVGHYKKLKTKCEEMILEFTDDPCDDLKALATQSFHAMEVAFNGMSSGYEIAPILAGENDDLKKKAEKMITRLKEYEQERANVESRLKGALKALRAIQAAAEADARDATAKATAREAARLASLASATAGTPPAAPDISVAYCEALKPKTQLSAECRPDVYDEWLSSVKAWMEMSGFNKGSHTAQAELIKKRLSTEFAIQIRPFLTEGADPQGPLGIYSIIDKIYNKNFPKLAKQMAALTKKISGNEDVDSFYSKYMAALEEAGLWNMSKEELHGMLMIIALEPIADLREKLLEIEGTPTITQVHEKIQKWKTGKILTKAATKSTTKLNNIKGGPNPGAGRGGNRGRGRGRGGQSYGGRMRDQPIAPSSIKVTPHTMRGKCLVCASTEHSRDSCPVFHDARCEPNGCGKVGHRKPACLEAYYKWKTQWEQAGCPTTGPLAAQSPPGAQAAGRGRGRGRGRGGHPMRALGTDGEQPPPDDDHGYEDQYDDVDEIDE